MNKGELHLAFYTATDIPVYCGEYEQYCTCVGGTNNLPTVRG